MEIVLDQRIRDWVFLPLIFVMFMIGIFRFYLAKYNQYTSPVPKDKSSIKVQENVNNNIIQKSKTLETNFMILSDLAYRMRKQYFCKKDTGLLFKKFESQNDLNSQLNNMQPMNNNMMVDMMKNNLSMAVSTMGQFAWVNFFFKGFILAKIPFPLTQKFRSMLQNGVDIKNIDVRYVSSLSLYFLVLFGLNGLQSLILNSDSEDDQDGMQALNEMNRMQQQMMPTMPGQQPDFGSLFTQQRESLDLVKHNFALENSSVALLKEFQVMYG